MGVNDVTGARIITGVPSSNFRENFDLIFGKKEKKMKVFGTFEEVEDMLDCRKRPIIIQAKQINEEFQVNTLEGNYKTGKPGDYLMKGIDGELYICDREIFEKTYDWVE